MFFTMFFLILGRGCVPKLGAATLVGLLAGLLCTLLGMGKGGPLIILKFVVPGLIVDLAGLFSSGLAGSYVACAIVGGPGGRKPFSDHYCSGMGHRNGLGPHLAARFNFICLRRRLRGSGRSHGSAHCPKTDGSWVDCVRVLT